MSLEPSNMRQKALQTWYQQQARDLPWRTNRMPYPVWISEMMLQQTQVKTVVPKFLHWMHLFPSIQQLAEASENQVLKAWEGLGYYRRARFIHHTAQYICAQHGGVFPQDFDTILALKGIGRSTAGAIASICFGMPSPVLDGNVKRVLRRWYGDVEASDKQLWFWATAEISTQHEDVGQWNQAMMELGATLCQARRITCDRCPVTPHCAAAFQQQPAAKAKPIQVKQVYWQVWLHQHPTKGIWVTQRPEKGIWAKLWCLPIIELKECLENEPDHIHALTHRRLHLYLQKGLGTPVGDGQWMTSLDQVAIPTGIRHLLEKRQVL